MHALLMVVANIVLRTAPGDVVYVQASALNLRARPTTSSLIRVRVPIGSECLVVSMVEEDWAELQCLGSRGFGKSDLIGPQKPKVEGLLERSQEAGLSIVESLNLLQRAVTVEPSNLSAQQAFQSIFWRAEFDRLEKARSANDTLKTAQPVPWPTGCVNAQECARAVLHSDGNGAWEEFRFRGKDVVHARVFSDGLLQLRSGRVDEGPRTVTVELESLTVPSEEVVAALGAPLHVPSSNACHDTEPPYKHTLACGYGYTQNLGVEDGFAACARAATDTCDECSSACESACGGCRLKCGIQGRNECVEICVANTRTCVAQCSRKRAAVYASCDAKVKKPGRGPIEAVQFFYLHRAPYSKHLKALFERADKRAEAEYGGTALNFDIESDSQDAMPDFKSTVHLEIVSQEAERAEVKSTFTNWKPMEMRFSLLLEGGHWVIDDIRSVTGEWLLSKSLEE